MIKRAAFLFSIACLVGCSRPAPPGQEGSVPDRIVSLAPNITETLYALKLEDKLVGATTFCTHPPAARNIPRVGGFGQFNYEAMLALKPDLVIGHKEYTAEKSRIENLGIPYLETGSYFIADILGTIQSIGASCGAEQQAGELIDKLNARMAELKQEGAEAPRVLITFGGNADDNVGQIHAFGAECIHNELLELAGGRNVIEGRLPYSMLSKEAVLRLNPDIIITLAPGLEATDQPSRAWKALTSVNAVKNNRVYLLTGSHTCIPGPRFIQTLEDFSRILGDTL
jgi:iron complex transport system substrate-binding protein